MKCKIVIPVILIFFYLTSSYASELEYTSEDVSKLVPKQTSKGWWHKQVNTMPDNRYMSSFQSLDHKGKLYWDKQDIAVGKINIVKAMELAKRWTKENTPFGNNDWEIESVTYLLRSGDDDEIEYICAVTLKTPEYKTIEIIILPNNEIIPPVIDPKF